MAVQAAGRETARTQAEAAGRHNTWRSQRGGTTHVSNTTACSASASYEGFSKALYGSDPTVLSPMQHECRRHHGTYTCLAHSNRHSRLQSQWVKARRCMIVKTDLRPLQHGCRMHHLSYTCLAHQKGPQSAPKKCVPECACCCMQHVLTL